jgi:hypothetical protein
MTKREKVLASAVCVILGAVALSRGVGWYRDTLDANRAELREVEQELSQARTAKLRGQRAVNRLRRWQRQSLPTNPDVASSLYEDWLQKQLTEAGLKVLDLKNTKSMHAPNDRFQDFNFIVNAEGSLRQLTDFLSRFYRAGHLQRISRASLAPAKNGDALAIEITIDARAMRDAPHADKLTDRESSLELRPTEELHTAISDRNFFSESRKTTETPKNEADQAFVSGMIMGEKGWQMSVRLQDSGRMLYFHAGDSIQVGQFSGTVSEIDGRKAVVKATSGNVQVFLGQKLSEAQPLANNAG